MNQHSRLSQQIKSIGTVSLLVILHSLSPSKVAQAKSPSDISSPSHTSEKKTLTIAQANSVRGRWILRYSSGLILHESVLFMYGSSGEMTTRFYDPLLGKTSTVVQTMRASSSARGMVIIGSRPVYPRTNILHPRYSPDSFLFRINPDGSVMALTCDIQQNCSPVEVSAF